MSAAVQPTAPATFAEECRKYIVDEKQRTVFCQEDFVKSLIARIQQNVQRMEKYHGLYQQVREELLKLEAEGTKAAEGDKERAQVLTQVLERVGKELIELDKVTTQLVARLPSQPGPAVKQAKALLRALALQDYVKLWSLVQAEPLTTAKGWMSADLTGQPPNVLRELLCKMYPGNGSIQAYCDSLKAKTDAEIRELYEQQRNVAASLAARYFDPAPNRPKVTKIGSIGSDALARILNAADITAAADAARQVYDQFPSITARLLAGAQGDTWDELFQSVQARLPPPMPTQPIAPAAKPLPGVPPKAEVPFPKPEVTPAVVPPKRPITLLSPKAEVTPKTPITVPSPKAEVTPAVVPPKTPITLPSPKAEVTPAVVSPKTPITVPSPKVEVTPAVVSPKTPITLPSPTPVLKAPEVAPPKTPAPKLAAEPPAKPLPPTPVKLRPKVLQIAQALNLWAQISTRDTPTPIGSGIQARLGAWYKDHGEEDTAEALTFLSGLVGLRTKSVLGNPLSADFLIRQTARQWDSISKAVLAKFPQLLEPLPRSIIRFIARGAMYQPDWFTNTEKDALVSAIGDATDQPTESIVQQAKTDPEAFGKSIAQSGAYRDMVHLLNACCNFDLPFPPLIDIPTPQLQKIKN